MMSLGEFEIWSRVSFLPEREKRERERKRGREREREVAWWRRKKKNFELLLRTILIWKLGAKGLCSYQQKRDKKWMINLECVPSFIFGPPTEPFKKQEVIRADLRWGCTIFSAFKRKRKIFEPLDALRCTRDNISEMNCPYSPHVFILLLWEQRK